MKIPIRIIFQQHLTRQMSNHGLSTITSEELDKEPSGSSIDEDVERGDSSEQERPLGIS